MRLMKMDYFLPMPNVNTHRYCKCILADAAVGLRSVPRAEQGKRVEVQAQPTHSLKLDKNS